MSVDWEQWRADRAQSLATPHGWLSLTAFHWLPQEPARLDGLPGLWWSEGGLAHLRAEPGDGLTVDERPLDGEVTARVAEGGSVLWVGHGDSLVELALRAGRHLVRLRDPQARTRTRFAGVPTYAHDESWVRPGRFTPAGRPSRVEVATAREDLRQHAEVVGTVDVDIDGRTHRLAATRGPGGGLSLAFHDETNGRETARWRVVGAGDPGPDGGLVVDFNRAVNLPFAFTHHGTCPAPVAGNSLPLAVTAGERAPA